MITLTQFRIHYNINSARDRNWTAELLAAGRIIAQAFANFYVITTRGDADMCAA